MIKKCLIAAYNIAKQHKHHCQQSYERQNNKCVSVQRRRGAVIQLRATPRPLFKGNISAADCMPLSNLLITNKINGVIECKLCIKKSRFSMTMVSILVLIWFCY